MSTSPKKASDILERMRSVAVRERGEESADIAVPDPEPSVPATAQPAAPRTPRAKASRQAAPAPAPPPATRPAGEKPVRYTLDLSREQHRFLKQFALDAEVDASEVMRTLLRQLQQDAGLAAKVQSKLG